MTVVYTFARWEASFYPGSSKLHTSDLIYTPAFLIPVSWERVALNLFEPTIWFALGDKDVHGTRLGVLLFLLALGQGHSRWRGGHQRGSIGRYLRAPLVIGPLRSSNAIRAAAVGAVSTCRESRGRIYFAYS